jgi:hypothetical protein
MKGESEARPGDLASSAMTLSATANRRLPHIDGSRYWSYAFAKVSISGHADLGRAQIICSNTTTPLIRANLLHRLSICCLKFMGIPIARVSVIIPWSFPLGINEFWGSGRSRRTHYSDLLKSL